MPTHFPFHPASPVSLAAFLGVILIVVLALIWGVELASRRLRGSGQGRAFWTALGVLLWLRILSSFVESGALQNKPMPNLLIFFAASNFMAVGIAFSRLGKDLSRALSPAALLAFQGFRLPLELVLHSWAKQGTIPETMTWTGSNFDIIAGISALVLPLLMKKSAPKTAHRLAWLGNALGFALLLNVARVAVLSSPLPFAWGVVPPLQLAFHLPYAWIIPICVSGALAGHLILTRALLNRPLPA